jgi:hypothetical protein
MMADNDNNTPRATSIQPALCRDTACTAVHLLLWRDDQPIAQATASFEMIMGWAQMAYEAKTKSRTG